MTIRDPLDVGALAWETSLLEGDIVSLGPNEALVFEIMAVRGDRAWVRALDDGRDGVIDLTKFGRFGRCASGMMQ